MNRGRGIAIFDSAKDILAHLAKQRSGSNWVAQKYIEKLMLMEGRKFDIRAYVLVAPNKKVLKQSLQATAHENAAHRSIRRGKPLSGSACKATCTCGWICVWRQTGGSTRLEHLPTDILGSAYSGHFDNSGCEQVYLYNDGYIRTTCNEYSLDNLADKTVHLTHDEYQRVHEDYGKFEDCNKLSFSQFEAGSIPPACSCCSVVPARCSDEGGLGSITAGTRRFMTLLSMHRGFPGPTDWFAGLWPAP